VTATDPKATTPTTVRAPVGAAALEVDWADGHTSVLPNAFVRGYCPCAGCQGHSGEIKYIPGQNAVITSIEEVGAYALQFTWGDGHGSGIYSFRYLRRLGELAATGGDVAGPRPSIPRSVT
jgi:DUF971 family protein